MVELVPVANCDQRLKTHLEEGTKETLESNYLESEEAQIAINETREVRHLEETHLQSYGTLK